MWLVYNLLHLLLSLRWPACALLLGPVCEFVSVCVSWSRSPTNNTLIWLFSATGVGLWTRCLQSRWSHSVGTCCGVLLLRCCGLSTSYLLVLRPALINASNCRYHFSHYTSSALDCLSYGIFWNCHTWCLALILSCCYECFCFYLVFRVFSYPSCSRPSLFSWSQVRAVCTGRVVACWSSLCTPFPILPFPFVPVAVLKILCYSFVYCHLQYCIMSWGTANNSVLQHFA